MFPWKDDGPHIVAGLMSGTSADGMDVALVEVSGRGTEVSATLLAYETIPYSPQARTFIHRCMDPEHARLSDVTLLGVYLAEVAALAVQRVAKAAGIAAADIAAVGFHGQTLLHHPQPEVITGLKVRGTFQAGNGSVLCERLGVPVVYDFRSRDMAAGGQGAPLTGYTDYLLFRNRSRGRLILNVGGISNITALPVDVQAEDVIAFDTGPGNTLLDLAAQEVSGGAETMDRDGARAQRGRVNDHLLSELMNHPFLQQEPPKSLDRQTFGPAFLKHLVKEHPGLSGDDLLATLTQFTVNANLHAVLTHLNKGKGMEELIVYGGGARNPELMKRMRAALPRFLVSSGDDYGIPAAAREAVAFAVLAHLTMSNQPGNLPSITGAARAVPLGAICFP